MKNKIFGLTKSLKLYNWYDLQNIITEYYYLHDYRLTKLVNHDYFYMQKICFYM